MKRDNNQTKTEGKIIATLVILFCLFAVWHNCHGQAYLSIAAGTATDYKTDNAVLTYQADLLVVSKQLGGRASFSQTDGINHTFDSYTLSGVYKPLKNLYFLAGYRYDNGRIWSKDVSGFNFGAVATIPVQPGFKIKIEGSHTASERPISNILVGVELKVRLAKNRNKRFF